MDDDLRRYKRLGWNRAGKVSALTGKVLAHCFVKNISPNGARLLVAKPATVPDHFKLQVRGAKLQPNCRVRWRKGKEIGVQFFP
jgi:PilZ domain